ncbi:MAG: HEAT repeat domain-containing protein [Theionarchaea archaeon]|nr:HEAT repeat domain-containing protein [Theionarchaea archaeon]
MDKEEKLRMLQELDEKMLTKRVIIPLYESEGMGYKNVQYTHRVLEFGKDIVCYKVDEYRDRIYTGIQVKKTKIAVRDVSGVLRQVFEAFGNPFIGSDGKEKRLDRFVFLTSGEVTKEAKDSLWAALRGAQKEQLVKCIDGSKLVDLLNDYLPSAFWKEYDHFTRYFCAMKKEFETITDVMAIGQREPVSLEEIYVSLKLSKEWVQILRENLVGKQTEKGIDKQTDEERFHIEESRKREQIFDADDIIKKFDKMVILGAPGSGKSTLLKHLTLKFCKENLEKQERISVPVLIPLKQFSESEKDVLDYMVEVFDHFDFPQAKKFIEKDLKDGKCVLLFDGYDELVTFEKQLMIARKIEEFMHAYGKNRFVVTSRIAGYHNELKGFEKLEIMEFNDHQIEQFVMNWFGKVDPQKAQSMSRIMRENERIREIARNPLMIAIIAIVYEEDRELPQRRVYLYERCVDVLLRRWAVQKKITDAYDTKAKEKILRRLALEAHLKEKKTFVKEELVDIISRYVSRVGIEKEKAEDVLKEIVERNVLLREISLGIYGFLHLSFQEYLVALELHETRDYETLLSHLYEPWWEEVVLLFAGFDRDATHMIQQVKARTQDDRFKEDIFCSNLMLLGKCIADADYTDEEMRDQIVNDLWHLYREGEFSSLREKALEVLALIKPITIIDSLLDELKDERSEVRESAADVLGKIGSEKAVDPLIRLLTDDDSDFRESAADVLGKIGSEKAVNPLIRLLTDDNSNVRWRAADTLGQIGSEKAVNPLIRLLTDDNSSVRWSAAYALGQIGSEKAVDPLIELLTDDNSNVRWSAAYALGQIGSEKAVDPLIRLLTDNDSRVRWKAADALGQIGSEKAVDPLIELLTDDNSNIRESAAYALGKTGSEKPLDPLIRLLTDDKSNIRESAAYALGQIGSEKAVDPLIELLTDDNSNVRESAADALGQIGSEKAVDPLIRLLTDDNSNVGWKAADTLGQIGSEKAVDPLIELLTSDNSSVRESAADVLGQIGSEKAVDPLIELLTSDNSSVRESAADALGQIGSEKAVDPLIRLLTDNDSRVRWSAAYALGQIGSEKAVDPLKKDLKDEEKYFIWKVKDKAFNSLEKISKKHKIRIY